MTTVQIFGVKNCPASRAAERFFKERRIGLQFVDLKQKPMSPGEIRRFTDKFRLDGIVHAAAHFDSLQPFEQQAPDEWNRNLQVNVTAPFLLTRACMPLLWMSSVT